MVRHVYVHEDTLVPPGVETNVPVDLTWSSLRTPKADWLVEPKRLRPGVFVSRTLLPGDGRLAAVRVVNASSYLCKIQAGNFIGSMALAAAPMTPVTAPVEGSNSNGELGRSNEADPFRSKARC